MKKVALILIVFVLLFSIANYSFADESNKIYIEELDLSVVVPAGYDTFTRDTAVNDPLYSKYGITHDQMLSTMKTQGSYLDAISSDRKTEIAVSAFSTSNSDFNQLSDTAILSFASDLKEYFTKNGLTVTNYEIYTHSQTKFVKIFGYRPVSGSTIHTLEYSTVFGGKTINVTLQSYSGTGISSTQESVMGKVIDSVVFNASSAKKPGSTVSSGNSLSATKSDSSIASTQANQGSISGFTLFYLAIAATVIYIGLHYYFKERNKAKANEKEIKQTTSIIENPPVSTRSETTGNTVSNGTSRNNVLQENGAPKYCRKCGNRLLPDSVFCDHCGTKIQ